MARVRRRPRKKNMRIPRLILAIVVILLFLGSLLTILGRFMTATNDNLEEAYKKAADLAGCTWEELVVYDMVRFGNKLDDVDPYQSAVDFLNMYYQIGEYTQVDGEGFWKMVSSGTLGASEDICGWLHLSANSDIQSILEAASEYTRPQYLVRFYPKELDDLMLEKKFNEEQIRWADRLMNAGTLEQLFEHVNDLPYYIQSEVGGYFAWPTPELHTVTSKFSAARKHLILGITRAHNGVDISGADAMGSPVVAIDDGVVLSVNLNGGERGVNIRVQHNMGEDVWVSRYQHLASVEVEVGQVVAKGTVIGTVGNSGISTGPHLHLELTYNGVLVDPLPMIK
ncbi:M23 family metallopeptidase [Aminipila butyrica]|uniref:M23 family metallopeptidase n=1 Tax=Aminipila butyrica TaxID=433296 RepID=A0A858BTI4_9FIRM|nr:M23 family metallopeptidase [Aminipila butyrica]QIB69321.1 M23 family metallopeptidase [Aminipila butyrica]